MSPSHICLGSLCSLIRLWKRAAHFRLCSNATERSVSWGASLPITELLFRPLSLWCLLLLPLGRGWRKRDVPILSAGFSAGKSTRLCAQILCCHSKGFFGPFFLFQTFRNGHLKWPDLSALNLLQTVFGRGLWRSSSKGETSECKSIQTKRFMQGTLNCAVHNKAVGRRGLLNKNTGVKAYELHAMCFIPLPWTARSGFGPIYQSHCKCDATDIHEASSIDLHHLIGMVDSRGLFPTVFFPHPLQEEKQKPF